MVAEDHGADGNIRKEGRGVIERKGETEDNN